MARTSSHATQKRAPSYAGVLSLVAIFVVVALSLGAGRAPANTALVQQAPGDIKAAAPTNSITGSSDSSPANVEVDNVAITAARQMGEENGPVGEQQQQQQQQGELPVGPAAADGWGTSGRKIEWLHIPKTGTSFGNTLLLWACPSLQRRLWITTKGAPAVPSECRQQFRMVGGHSNGCTERCDIPGAASASNASECLQQCPLTFTEAPGDATLAYDHYRWFIGAHHSLEKRSDPELRNVFTVVRSPRRRVVSGYFQILTDRHRSWFRDDPQHLNVTTEGVCEAAQRTTSVHLSVGAQARLIAGERLYLVKSRGRHFASPAPPSEEVTKEACRRLDLFAFVGITDFWDASICLFHAKHGGEVDETLEYKNVRPGNYNSSSTSASSQQASSSAPQGLSSADCGDDADERVFECALEVFLKEVDSHPKCAHLVQPKQFDMPRADAMLNKWLAKHSAPAAAATAGEAAR